MKVNKSQYIFHVLSKISEDPVYCGRCDRNWPKRKLKTNRAYDIYIRDPEGHPLFIFCYDCDTPYKNSDVAVHERGGRKTMFCPKLHKVKVEIHSRDLRKLFGLS